MKLCICVLFVLLMATLAISEKKEKGKVEGMMKTDLDMIDAESKARNKKKG